MHSVLKLLALYVALSVFLVLLWLGLGGGELPATATQWLWLLVLAVPLHLVGELIAYGLWYNRAARFVEQKTAGKRISVFRMLYAFFMIVFFCGVIVGAAHFWELLKGHIVT
ncbi:hypothetical protein KY495_05550 [Massilia sp. PAMC28688]|uniref:hypothetical protein n=1 Tax=Massilia sp. PAMC28688 TaxID=2861283 RepID=UPI001C6264F3|nr:hypothetical protein [Massilia sp. PAMC28688]QYF94662.1 hypothetical protein KY495_05550 [Massilia sp. PAMC28688]